MYLFDGNWFGTELFPSDWVSFSTQQVPNSHGEYGAHIWLNGGSKYLAGVPEGSYSMNGFGGQRIFIIPQNNLVITILSGREPNHDYGSLLRPIIEWKENHSHE